MYRGVSPPPGEFIAWRVPKGTTYRLIRLEERNSCVEGKEPKTNDALSGTLDCANAEGGWVNQLATLKQGPPIYLSIRPWGQTAGVGSWQER